MIYAVLVVALLKAERSDELVICGVIQIVLFDFCIFMQRWILIISFFYYILMILNTRVMTVAGNCSDNNKVDEKY